jgi:hypothetical protein
MTLVTTRLLDTPIIVVSNRLVTRAKELNFKHVYLAKNASDAAIITTLRKKLCPIIRK